MKIAKEKLKIKWRELLVTSFFIALAGSSKINQEMSQMAKINEKTVNKYVILESATKIIDDIDKLNTTWILCRSMSIEKIRPWKIKSENRSIYNLSEITKAAKGGFEYLDSKDGIIRIRIILEVVNHDPNKRSEFGLTIFAKEGTFNTSTYSCSHHAEKDFYQDVNCEEIVKESASKATKIQNTLIVFVIAFIVVWQSMFNASVFV